MSPTPGNNPPDGLPRYAQHEFASSSPGAVFHAASPAESPHSASKGRKGGIDVLESLRALPEVRSIPWQAGKELPADKSTNSPRSQTRGAFLLSTRGHITPPCTHCATGVGRFSVCVSLEGWFHGACATCQVCFVLLNLLLSDGGADGDKRELVQSQERRRRCVEMAPSPPFIANEPEPDSVPPNKWVEPYAIQSSPPIGSNRPASSLKRKRASPSPTAAAVQSPKNSYTQIHPARPASSHPAASYQLHLNNPSLNNSPASNHPPNNILQGGTSALLNHVYQKQYPPNGTKRHQVLYRAQSISPEPGKSATPLRMNTFTLVGAEQTSKAEMRRDGSNSLSPSTQLVQPTQHPSYNSPYPNTSMAMQSEARNVGHPATPLIDTLPRRKQKQIYQIIGGVQSGLRLVRQQTESMQKQLDLLQAALGIEDDDEHEASVI